MLETFHSIVYFLAFNPIFGFHHHHSSGSGGSVDPVLDGIVKVSIASMAILASCGIIISAVAAPILLVRFQRIRRILIALPALDILLYLLIIVFRPYPGGFLAQFQMPGLIYTAIEMILLFILLIASPLIAIVIYYLIKACQYLKRKRISRCPQPNEKLNH